MRSSWAVRGNALPCILPWEERAMKRALSAPQIVTQGSQRGLTYLCRIDKELPSIVPEQNLWLDMWPIVIVKTNAGRVGYVARDRTYEQTVSALTSRFPFDRFLGRIVLTRLLPMETQKPRYER